MEISGFSVFDIGVLAILFLGALFGLVTGFVRGGLFVASWIGAGLVTMYGFEKITPFAAKHIQPEWVAYIASGAGLFIVALIIFHLISHILSGWIKTGRLNALDRSLGLLAGLGSAALVISVAFLFMSDVWGEDTPEWNDTARTWSAVERGALLVRDLLPENIIGGTGAVLQKAQERANDVGAARKALDRLTRPPESSAPPPQEGYKDGARERLEDLIRKTQ
ncbi:MAG: CvpA family protein [Alphaproteobacteria bacterium]|nr:CvpA family protein [Alphaproteobacteria bacterium]